METLRKRVFKMSATRKRLAMRLLRCVLVLYLALVMLAVLCEKQLIYHPVIDAAGMGKPPPDSAGKGHIVPHVQDCRLSTRDGVKIHGWYCTPQIQTGSVLQPVPVQRVILFFHGNGGSLIDRYPLMAKLVSCPAAVFLIDYEGYGQSGGTPSEEGLYRDADAAWHDLTVTRGVPAAHIILFGESLGNAPAIDLARRVHPAGLIVQSAFTSMPDMCRVTLPFVPPFLVRTQMDNLDKIRQASCPILIIHSHKDEVVPYWMGRKLFDAAPAPKQFFEIWGATHNTTAEVGGPPYFAALRRFVGTGL